MAQQLTHCRLRVGMYKPWPDTYFWPVSCQQMRDQSTPTIDSLLTEQDNVRYPTFSGQACMQDLLGGELQPRGE